MLQRLLITTVGIATVAIMPLGVVHGAQGAHHGCHHGSEHGGAMHDTRTEIRVTGIVEAVNHVTGTDGACCCGAEGGTHVTLKTAAASIEAHLGPTVWLREQEVNLAAGDTVEILGSRVTMHGAAVLVAREITKGATTWKLRPGAGPMVSHHCSQ